MTINIVFPQLPQILLVWKGIRVQLTTIQKTLDKLTMTVADAIQVLANENVKLDDISAKLTEGFAEIIILIGQLQNTTLTEEQAAIVTALQTKVDGIQPQAQAIADIVPGPTDPTPGP